MENLCEHLTANIAGLEKTVEAWRDELKSLAAKLETAPAEAKWFLEQESASLVSRIRDGERQLNDWREHLEKPPA